VHGRKLDFSHLEWTDAAPGARYKAYECDGRRVRLVEFTREFIEADWCHKGHIGIVLEGELDIDFGVRSEHFHSGEALFIRAGAQDKHKARSITPHVLLFLVED
jgi:hypothetical protein